jgi:hypothetical protein
MIHSDAALRAALSKASSEPQKQKTTNWPSATWIPSCKAISPEN